MYFIEAIEDMLEFDIDKTTKFDDTMAYGYTLIADAKVVYRKQQTVADKITDFFPSFKVKRRA